MLWQEKHTEVTFLRLPSQENGIQAQGRIQSSALPAMWKELFHTYPLVALITLLSSFVLFLFMSKLESLLVSK